MSGIFTGPLGEAAKKIEALNKEIEKTTKAVRQSDFKQIVVSILNKHPEIEAIRWRQYIPHFNDGEPCTFSVYDLETKFKTQAAVDKYCNYPESVDDFHYMGWKNNHGNPDIEKDYAELDIFIHSNEHLMESLFGNDAEITVHSGGVTVEECDHD